MDNTKKTTTEGKRSPTIVGVIEVIDASQLAADAIEGWPL